MSIRDYSCKSKTGIVSSSDSRSVLQGLAVNPYADALFCPRFKLEGGSPASVPAAKARQSAGPSRAQLLDWLSSLSKEELGLATLLQDTEFIENFLQNVPAGPRQLLHLPSSRSFTLLSSVQEGPSFDIFALLRVALTSEWQMHLEVEQINLKQFIQWLDIISHQQMFNLPQRSASRREKNQQNLLWFNSDTFHTLEEWLGNELEKAILSYYFSPRDRVDRAGTLQKYMLEKKSPSHCFRALDVPAGEMKYMTPLEKTKLAESIRSYEESMKDRLQEQMLDSENDKKPKKKRKSKKTRKEGIIEQPLSEVIKLNPEQEKSSREIKTETITIDCLATSEDLDELMPLLNKELNSCDFEEQEVEFSQTIELNFGDQTPTEVITKSAIATNITFNYEEVSGMTMECKLEEEFEVHEYLEAREGTEINRQRNSSHAHIGSVKFNSEEDKHDSESISVRNGEFSEAKAKRRRRRKGQKTQNKLAQEFKARVVSLVMNRQLNSMLDSLSLQSNSCYESKVIAFERVRYFAKSLYPGAEAILFGSNAVGLSLPSSDIDIMLVDLPCLSKEEVCDCLAQIAIYINAMGWVTSCSTYLGAKVPLVKLEIEPGVGYFTPKCRSNYFLPDAYSPCYLDMKDPSKAAPIKVDLMIANEECRASRSTELMRNWLEGNTTLQRVLLALKYTLAVRGFSQNFTGGIGSYCLFVMVAAFFVEFKEEREGKDCEIMLDILKFYGQDFENQLRVVTLGQGGSRCFISNEEARSKYQLSDQLLDTNLLKIIDPLYGKLMSSSCYQFNLVKAEWRGIRASIGRVDQLVEAEVELGLSSAEMTRLLENKKGLQKWTGKLMLRMDYSVAGIIERSGG